MDYLTQDLKTVLVYIVKETLKSLQSTNDIAMYRDGSNGVTYDAIIKCPQCTAKQQSYFNLEDI